MPRFGRAHFHREWQVDLIKGHGSSVLIFPCLQCPCVTEERQFDPLCESCGGNGRYYPDGLAYTTTLLLHHESSSRTFLEPGSWVSGDILCTVLPGIYLSERDKVRWLDTKDVYADEVLTRGLDDTVRFTAGVHLLIVADRERVYRPDIDYVLSPPATIHWLSADNQPPFGHLYTVKYEAFPDFLVVGDSPRLRVEHHLPQSQEVVLRRLDRISEDG